MDCECMNCTELMKLEQRRICGLQGLACSPFRGGGGLFLHLNKRGCVLEYDR